MRSYIEFLPKGTIIHKATTQNFLEIKDGKRETACHQRKSPMKVHRNWKYVNCESCLKRKKK